MNKMTVQLDRKILKEQNKFHSKKDNKLKNLS